MLHLQYDLPVIGCGNSSHSNSESRGCNLCAIEKIGTQEPNRYEKIEQEDKECRGNLGRAIGPGVA